jgi:DNA-binding MarR family transcriptional regulator
MDGDSRPRFDRIVHEPSRLMILTYLSTSAEEESSFTDLKDSLSLSAGNLSVQLKNLEEAGYVGITKTFRDNKPYTAARITPAGREAFSQYLGEMETLIESMKKAPKGVS